MFPNMKAKYISAEGKELGPGEAGELWLSGPNIFKGYWKQPGGMSGDSERFRTRL